MLYYVSFPRDHRSPVMLALAISGVSTLTA